jgi:hypothetical protein
MWAPAISLPRATKNRHGSHVGPALVTTSSGYLAYAARSLTRLSLLHKESQCDLLLSTSKATTSDMHSENPQASRSRYSRRRESMETLNWETMGRLKSLTPSRRDDYLSVITTQSNHPVVIIPSPLLCHPFWQQSSDAVGWWRRRIRGASGRVCDHDAGHTLRALQ